MAVAATHQVSNQPPPFPVFNLYRADLPLVEAVAANGAGWAEQTLEAYGALAGGELMALGELAARNRPRLHSHDRYGHRVDAVEYDRAYHEVMSIAVGHGLHAGPWQDDRPGAHVARAAMEYLHHQAEPGSNCPLTMTYAAVPVLRQAGALGEDWLRGVLSDHYDATDAHRSGKHGLLIGMGMTEKQGGSDVRSNTTRADRQADGSYLLTGHKWFFSAPMSDAFVVLAQAEGGLSCFLLPRWRSAGSRNGLRLMRLKDKLGNHANASSEVEFDQALAWRIGDEGRGVATILQMVALTRLDCMVGSAALMRQALFQALHHVSHRRAFGRLLREQPLMAAVLADLALESEAAMSLALRTARAIDASAGDAGEAALARVLTPLGKFWICRRAPAVVNEAMECLGGIGYVEESPLARLYREAPLNSIWEGCGNIQCLDLLRATRDQGTLAALDNLLAPLCDSDAIARARWRTCRAALEATPDDALEASARRLAANVAQLVQAGVLREHAPASVAHAFIGARLGQPAACFGQLPDGIDCRSLVDRALPAA
ncbi:MAG: acyl-CoA dehydrogenase family protein [Xanthomonadales bacterium]|nr:acyl-CoA dehydrogenase family protein [Xanthomonadales bacterium]